MLRWSPQVTLERGLERTVKWFDETGLLEAAPSLVTAPNLPARKSPSDA
jgi:hypothetical protein